MKELTIEEKAKRYDEAFETARKINSGEGVSKHPDWTTCEVIFPELKENKIKDIREQLIKAFSSIGKKEWGGVNVKDAIAWLEKQGEQNPTDKVEQKHAEWSEEDERERKRVVGLLEGWLSTFKETNYAEDCKCGIDWLKSIKDRYTWKPSKKQMEQLGWIAEQNKDNMIGKELMSLYQDLKKLREE